MNGNLQKTLSREIITEGIGLHSGQKTSVRIMPAPEDTGIVFLDGDTPVHAAAENVSDTRRGTTLSENGSTVRTIEHLMAALAGCGVDNAFAEVMGPEIPINDGSAKKFAEDISAAVVCQSKPKDIRTLTEPLYVVDGSSLIIALPSDTLSFTYVLDYDHPMIGKQLSRFAPREDDFLTELAPARTFCLYEEVAVLLERHLALGGSLDNAIVIWRDKMSAELRYPNELARHKVLDMLGDFSLCGNFTAEIISVKAGHTQNAAMTRKISAALRRGSEA
ncbi:MAG: UDP-3-O-[3-hydroxymyristoyl] N-acetylglucosamine deacetylase [Abditibacteriota bacterium]|nr:UDP-3-O-[3-hydroxymyristoyl] N-acetylglucosamine deacetylase [Abditibacteriota bacterium]MBP5092621.1 UDP-3-O-[3-hydroxymyristoyl] N-acetylglucosamine deacetylase [Abditibacteriota bacterium]MBP5737892.1 UDP-3-O-[3-hydroxymyristoyl] N-acetylglucosamine deacetylase [Abditibacteriota bacterium]